MAFSEWESVESSNLDAVRFNGEDGSLEIRFKNGSVYAWDGVTQDHATNLIKAESPGRHFLAYIQGEFGVGRKV